MAIDKILEYAIYQEETTTNETQEIKLKISEENNMYIVHRSLIRHLSEHRQGTANCKTRSEVRGGGRKPWKQKGSGKARAGSIRSPLWRGGGVIFGPKSKIYHQKINAKEKKLAIRNVLLNKYSQTLVVHEDELNLETPKTQLFQKKLDKILNNKNPKVLIIVNNKNTNLYLASRNLKHVELIQANQLNIVSLLNAKTIIATTEGLLTIQEVYNAD